MQPQIRRVGIGLLAAFMAVFIQLNYVQIFAAERIAGNPANIRALLREYSIKRGDIVTADGETVAESVPTKGRLKFLRTYPGGALFGHLTGYYSLVFGTDRIERSFNDQLLGSSGVISMQDIQDHFLGSGEQGDDVRLSVNSELQREAQAALGDNIGSIVAMDPQTGEVRAMWSNPSFDPTPLTTHDPREIRAAWDQLNGQSPNPLVNIATSRGFPPGSTFKVVTAAAALESGKYTPDSVFPDEATIDLPQTDQTLTNFTNTACTGTGQIDLFTALEISCDTTFALLGLDIHDEIFQMAEGLGFNTRIPFNISTEASSFPRVPDDRQPFRAFAGIGQGDVVATPLQMALVAAAIANDGVVPRPRLVKEVIDSSGDIVSSPPEEDLGRAMSQTTADEVTQMMIAVVESGTGVNAQIEGVPVAGKTGTAQSTPGAAPHAWFISFAPADDPQLAVAVFVANGGSFGAEATGGTVAAPMAKRVLEKDREIRGW
jgi:peptidoglycan glycosyltransferase